LAQLKVEEGCVLSVYVNLDPSELPTPADRSSALTSAADAVSHTVEERELPHDARLGLREDIQRIRDYAKSADFDGTHGLAIFAAGVAGLFEALHVPRPVENAVLVDRSPHVAPLVGAPNGAWSVALVNRRDARLLRGGPVSLTEEARIRDDVPGRHDQGGLSQGRFERHIDEHARQHLKRVARHVAEMCRDGAFDHLLVGGPEEGSSEFVDLLDNGSRDRLRGRISVEVDHATVAEVSEAAAPAMRRYEERRRDALLDRLREGLGADGHATAGLEDVLECLNEQRVEVLLLDAGLAGSGAQCPKCGWIGTLAEGECPADGTPLEPRADLIAPAVERALAQDAEVFRLQDRPDLGPHGGIAALLRF